ncbi:hypothetical protein HDE_02957 [Halotydeus destructor]|nr:hypothetical protein HDE_02957 [Halotydeus destructor]
MRVRSCLAFCLFMVGLVNSVDIGQNENSLLRLVRSAASKQQDCRYEKEAWENCDASTGLQRRALRLKPAARSEAQCEEVKFITRPCKKVCKYHKGTWTECLNGERSRIDQLKNGGSGCEDKRTIARKCKSVCRYSKSEWSSCEDNVKTKTLTLTEGDNKECEATRTITKQCAAQKPRAKANKKRGRKTKPNPDSEEA